MTTSRSGVLSAVVLLGLLGTQEASAQLVHVEESSPNSGFTILNASRYPSRNAVEFSDQHLIAPWVGKMVIADRDSPLCSSTIVLPTVADVFPGCDAVNPREFDGKLYDAAAGEWVAFSLAVDGRVCIGHAVDPQSLPWDYEIVDTPFEYRALSPRGVPTLAIWPTDEDGGSGSYLLFGHDVSPYDELAMTGLPDLSVYQDRVMAVHRGQLLGGVPPATQLIDLPHHLDARPVEFQLSLASPSILNGTTPVKVGADYPIVLARDTEIYPGPTPPGGDLIEIHPLRVHWSDPSLSTLGPVQEVVVSDFDQDICPFARTPAYGRSPTPDDCIETSDENIEYNFSFWLGELNYDTSGSVERLAGAIQIKNADGSAGVQWFTLEKAPSSSWSLSGEGRLPDGEDRFLGSATLDANGNLVVVNRATDATTTPVTEIWGRNPVDPVGTVNLLYESTPAEHSGFSIDVGNPARLDVRDPCVVKATRGVTSTTWLVDKPVSYTVQFCDCGPDPDGDGVLGLCDNCPDLFNPSQANEDGDEFGDACDPCLGDPGNDPDGDGLCSLVDPCEDCEQLIDPDGDGACFDNCPDVPNPDQRDNDGDFLGDVCDPDDDNDEILDGNDNCPFRPNFLQTNSDGDTLGDECDNCIDVNNEDQANFDGDPWGDVCDRCFYTPSPDNNDSDGDGQGDACDAMPECLPDCFIHITPGGPGGSGPPGCESCGAGLDRLGRIGPRVPDSAEEWLGFRRSSTTTPGACPPELAIIDLCCVQASCPDSSVSLRYPDPVGFLDLISTDFNIGPDAGFGTGLEFVTDMDQDGLEESAVGTPYEDRVDVFGSDSGAPVATLFGNGGELLGFALARHAAGILVGAPGVEPGALASSDGRVTIWDPVTSTFPLDLQGPTTGGRFGWDVATMKDFDGDGTQELVIGAPGIGSSLPGSVWIYKSDNAQLVEIPGLTVGEQFGFAVDICDHDGDGNEDVLVGVPRSLDADLGTEVGRVDIFDRDGNPVSTLYGAEPFGEFGAAISCGEDADGDGIDDLLVGSPGADANSVADSGRAFLYNVNQTQLAQWAGTNGERLGRNVLIASGQNEDSMGDLVISDAFGGDGRGTSRVYLSDGDNDGVDPNDDNCPEHSNPSQENSDTDAFGDACDNCPGIDNKFQTDTDDDGFGDLCDCAPQDPTVYPGAREALDGKDNQCPGDEGFGQLDEYAGTLRLSHDSANGTTIQWDDRTPDDPNDLHELARSLEPQFFSNCDLIRTAATSVVETDDPAPGEVFFYVLRHGEPHYGSWGETSNAGLRYVSCTP